MILANLKLLLPSSTTIIEHRQIMKNMVLFSPNEKDPTMQ